MGLPRSQVLRFITSLHIRGVPMFLRNLLKRTLDLAERLERHVYMKRRDES